MYKFGKTYTSVFVEFAYLYNKFPVRKGREIDLEQWISLVGNVGFPIVVAFYLLIRFERKIDNLTDAINKMSDIMENRNKKE